MDLLSTLIRLFTTYGYSIVFFGVMLENAGIPVPGETILLAAGFFASQQRFTLSLVILIAAAGAIIGDNLGYLAGRRLGRAFAERYGRYVLLTPARMKAGEDFFERHGDKTILIARFVSGLRVFAAFFAGMSRMRWRTFLVYNAAGAVLWAVAISLVGYFFGHSWHLIERWLGRASLLVFGMVVAWAALVALRKWQQRAAAGEDRAQPRMLEMHEVAVVLFNLVLIALFIELSLAVAQHRDPRFDQTVITWLHGHAQPWLDQVMIVVTHCGDAVVRIAVSLAVAAFFYRRYGRRREALAMLLALGLGEGFNYVFKLFFQRARPDLWETLIHLDSFSFPSGHAMGSTIVYGSAAFLFAAAFPRFRWAFRLGAAVLVFLIGLSRVYLGVHWPSDVLGGFAAGLVVVFIVAYWYARDKTPFAPQPSAD